MMAFTELASKANATLANESATQDLSAVHPRAWYIDGLVSLTVAFTEV